MCKQMFHCRENEIAPFQCFRCYTYKCSFVWREGFQRDRRNPLYVNARCAL